MVLTSGPRVKTSGAKIDWRPQRRKYQNLFVFFDSVSVLRFNFVLFCVRFRLGMLISLLGFVFLFSGSVFLFWVSVLSMSFCFGFVLFYFCCCCCLVVFLFLSATLYIWKSSAFNIQPLENTSKLRWKFLHRYQIDQVRNNLL